MSLKLVQFSRVITDGNMPKELQLMNQFPTGLCPQPISINIFVSKINNWLTVLGAIFIKFAET